MAAQAGFSEQERAAMSARARELASTKGVKGAAKRARELQACLEAIDALPEPDQHLASRLHMLVSEEAPMLAPKTWYGFPAYAWQDKVIVFFQPASKFETRYGTVGFTEDASLDSGDFWPTSYALLRWEPTVEKELRTLVKQAVSAIDPTA